MTSSSVARPRPAARPASVLLLILAALAAAVLGPVPAATAHSTLVSSTPSSGATVASAPATVTLTFNEDISPQFVVVKVTGPGDAAATTGRASVSGATVTQRLQARRPAGEYAVTYRVVSADGHPVAGTVRFRARASVGVATSSTAASSSPSPTASSTSGGSTTARSSTTGAPHPGSTPTAASGAERVGFWDVSHLPGFLAVAVLLLGGVGIALYQRRRRI